MYLYPPHGGAVLYGSLSRNVRQPTRKFGNLRYICNVGYQTFFTKNEFWVQNVLKSLDLVTESPRKLLYYLDIYQEKVCIYLMY